MVRWGSAIVAVDDNDPDSLPYRSLTENADMREYLEETAEGVIPKRTVSRVTGKEEDYELVTFFPNDPENPKNWPKGRKWYCTMVVAFTCFVVAFNSAVITADLGGVSEDFNVSGEVALLTITMFVIGFGVGPMAFAPMSEMLGRKIVYLSTLAVAVVFIIPCAVSKNIGTLLVCRLIDGIAFSAPMTLVGGTLADLWKNEERGVPMAAFSAAPFIGPAIGPLVGGYLSDATSWRWLYWIQLILSGAAWLLIATVPETYAPTLLSRRAAKLRKEKNDDRYTTEKELDPRPLSERLRIFLVRPFQLLFLEPIILFITIYMSVLYGLLYMFFVAFPLIFEEGKGYSAGQTGLMFIPLAVGVIMSSMCSPFVNKHYNKLCAKAPNGRPVPETRLLPMMFGCWFIPVGLFIFAWTSYPHVSAWGPMIGGWPVGFGFIFLYNSANNYIVDTYQHQAASGLAAKTFLRSIWGAVVVLFTEQMYHRLGYEWAGTLMAFISLACCLIPFVFYYWGAKIRKYSKYAYGDEELDANTAGAVSAAKKEDIEAH
ncbi:putative mfs multidrug transporter [Phaeomoniella chlamydospora]|uniref:Putative mfs multidrug transporter n=1 Tax=Phaeomoniella chlamydospora TaxID=158046 RepID=A0A0G2H4L2_PHACM|nr:putative mfs multidrug transporter [Phaeomoniella chlamydospora]